MKKFFFDHFQNFEKNRFKNGLKIAFSVKTAETKIALSVKTAETKIEISRLLEGFFSIILGLFFSLESRLLKTI